MKRNDGKTYLEAKQNMKGKMKQVFLLKQKSVILVSINLTSDEAKRKIGCDLSKEKQKMSSFFSLERSKRKRNGSRFASFFFGSKMFMENRLTLVSSHRVVC